MGKHILVLAGVLAATMAAPAAAQEMDNEAVQRACVPDPDRIIRTREEGIALVTCANREAARQLNAQTPIQVDQVTTLTGVEATGAHLLYLARINVDAATLDAGAPGRLEQGTRQYVCGQTDMRNTMNLGGTYGYRWTDRSGQRIHEIRIERC